MNKEAPLFTGKSDNSYRTWEKYFPEETFLCEYFYKFQISEVMAALAVNVE